MLISYCSQVKNRFYQFEQTFKHNLDHIINNLNTEWIIVDCDSNDGLYNHMRNLGIIDRVHYYRTLDYKKYSIPVAKNFAIRLSSGDYIFNLDIDNYIANATYNINKIGLNQGVCCNIFKRGIYGRIGCSKKMFNIIGGYDESFLPAAKHDTDLINRCQLIGYEFQNIPCSKYPVENSKTETIKNTKSIFSWKMMNFLNTRKMNYNLRNKIYCPNKRFTNCTFEYNFTKIIKLPKELI
jgi:glycosyltransferase involved in cell wall biosynthesis